VSRREVRKRKEEVLYSSRGGRVNADEGWKEPEVEVLDWYHAGEHLCNGECYKIEKWREKKR
jgi:hypothetical protein